MKKQAKVCNINQFIHYCVLSRMALQIFTPKSIGQAVALVPIYKEKPFDAQFYHTKKTIDTKDDIQLENPRFQIVIISDIL